jgi:hypothetical protein
VTGVAAVAWCMLGLLVKATKLGALVTSRAGRRRSDTRWSVGTVAVAAGGSHQSVLGLRLASVTGGARRRT